MRRKIPEPSLRDQRPPQVSSVQSRRAPRCGARRGFPQRCLAVLAFLGVECVGHAVGPPEHALNVARMVADVKFVCNKLFDFVYCPRLALFEKSLKIACLLVRELQGRQAPEARNQSIWSIFISRSEPLAANTAACTDSSRSLLEYIARIEIVHETETADDFWVVRLFDFRSQFIVS